LKGGCFQGTFKRRQIEGRAVTEAYFRDQTQLLATMRKGGKTWAVSNLKYKPRRGGGGGGGGGLNKTQKSRQQTGGQGGYYEA